METEIQIRIFTRAREPITRIAARGRYFRRARKRIWGAVVRSAGNGGVGAVIFEGCLQTEVSSGREKKVSCFYIVEGV